MSLTKSTILAASAVIGACCGPALADSVFVSSGDTDSVLAYDATTGAFQQTFATGGGLDGPEGIRFGPDGNFYVTSRSNEVLRYDGQLGTFLNVFASGNGLVDPAGLAFGGPDNDLFVSSGIPDDEIGGNQVLRFDGATGAFEAVLDPDNDAELDDPEGLTFGPDGLLYVLSAEAGEVLRYNGATNAFVDTFVAADASGDLADPTDLTFGPDGDLFVSSAETSEVKRYDGTTGEFEGNFIEANSGGLNEAEGVVFGPNGNLLVVSELGDAVLEFDGNSGAFVREFVAEGSGGLAEPTFITTGATPIPLPPAAWSGMLTIGGLMSLRAWHSWRGRAADEILLRRHDHRRGTITHMRRRARQLFTLASMLSLILFVATCALWVRSYRQRSGPMVSFGSARGTSFPAVELFARPERAAFLGSAAGRVLFIHQSAAQSGASPADASNCGVFGSPSFVMVYSPPHLFDNRGFLGFGLASQTMAGGTAGYSVLSIPYWAVFVVTMILPGLWLRSRIRDKRLARDGLCPSCGYDLRAARTVARNAARRGRLNLAGLIWRVDD